jgi:signal transduction histidine kinase/DNA-binding response OmpR family regulator
MFKPLGLKAKFATLFYLVSLGAMLTVGWYGYQNAKTAYRTAALDLVKGYTSEVSAHINDALQLSRSDLDFISNNYAIQRHSYWMDMGEEEKREQYHQIVADTLRGFGVSYTYNYKIRIINTDGHEHIKILRDSVTGQTQVIPDKELEDQSHRDFFTQAMRMSKGQIFTSALELNVEHGKITLPHLPVLHFATPLIGGNKVRYGVVEITTFAEDIFEHIRNANRNKQGQVFYLIAPNGDYLFHPEPRKCFGSQLGHLANFEQDFPHLLAQMRQQQEGVLADADHIITYRTIYPTATNKQNYWLLVGIVPESVAMAELRTFELSFAGLAVLVILLVFAITRYFLGNLMTPLEFVTKQLQSLGRGEVKVESLAYSGKDELKVMLDSTQALVANMEQLAKQADAIGKGDFSGQVKVLSDQDRLGFAINNMTQMLREARQTEQNRNWLRDGIEQLSKALTGDLTLTQLADLSISILGHYLAAGRGVFYSYNAEQQLLELLGSYMYSERNQVGSCFKLGEGAVGQVAREKKPIFLTTLNLEQPPIVTGTTASTPLYTYTYPLQRENNLLGVIELASFAAFDELQQSFLQEAAQVIASFLYVVSQRDKIKKLLEIAESAERDARDKNIRLQQANTQMEEQQQQLQQQTEELQQANAQMEEQQQQLQQQTEELQQTNAQMEETQIQIQQQNQRLIESQQELDARAKQLELANQYKSEFLANMSHELRTPLNSIILLSKMLAGNSDKHLNSDEVHHAEIIHSAGEELLRLINDVLDLSKIEAGRMDLHVGSISSQELLAELHGLFEHTAKEKKLQFNIQDDLRSDFTSDRNRLSQIVRNLLSNAFKFTKTGSVTLAISRHNDAKWPIQISVKDTGIGIAEEKRKLIFEAFAQADGSISRQYGGTGLGLSISLRFAQLLGGTITLNSSVGHGSEFSLCLPLTLASNTETAVPESTVSSSAPAPSLPKVSTYHTPSVVSDDREQLKERDSVILLIDDDASFGQALLEINRKLGYKTLLALTGKDGLELAERYKPNGILLDLGLPDMDGTVVLHELKIRPDLASIPVYIVSGREKDAALQQGGFLGYLQKPVDVEQISQVEGELIAFIHQAVAQTILVVEHGSITSAEIQQLVNNPNITVLKTTVDADFGGVLAEHACCLAIIDLNNSVAVALEVAKKLRQYHAKLNFVFLGQKALSDEEEAQLHQYSDSIIIKTPQSEQRLLKNIKRFLTEAVARPDKATVSLAQDYPGNGKRLEGRHILVVDDDARNLFVITAALEKESAKVSGVLNGKRALEFLQKQKVDMVFMDIMMPEMDGYQTVKALRSNPALAQIPVVVLTAKALSSDREKALAAGANDYLAKPADYDMLINMAAVWCSGKH